jgi:hypothetical protein
MVSTVVYTVYHYGRDTNREVGEQPGGPNSQAFG